MFLRHAFDYSNVEGVRGFFGGLETTLVFAPVISAISFTVYEAMKEFVSIYTYILSATKEI